MVGVEVGLVLPPDFALDVAFGEYRSFTLNESEIPNRAVYRVTGVGVPELGGMTCPAAVYPCGKSANCPKWNPGVIYK